MGLPTEPCCLPTLVLPQNPFAQDAAEASPGFSLPFIPSLVLLADNSICHGTMQRCGPAAAAGSRAPSSLGCSQSSVLSPKLFPEQIHPSCLHPCILQAWRSPWVGAAGSSCPQHTPVPLLLAAGFYVTSQQKEIFGFWWVCMACSNRRQLLAPWSGSGAEPAQHRAGLGRLEFHFFALFLSHIKAL